MVLACAGAWPPKMLKYFRYFAFNNARHPSSRWDTLNGWSTVRCYTRTIVVIVAVAVANIIAIITIVVLFCFSFASALPLLHNSSWIRFFHFYSCSLLSSFFSNKKWNASYMNWWRKIVRVFECDSFKPDIGHLATHYLMDWSLFISATFDNIKCHRKYTERTLNMNPILHGLFLFALLLLLLFFSRCCWNFRSTIVPCSLAFSLFIYINVPKVFWFFMDNRCTFISRYSQWNAFKYLLCVRLLLLLFYH